MRRRQRSACGSDGPRFELNLIQPHRMSGDYTPRSSVACLLRRAAIHFTEQIEAVLAEQGITIVQWQILLYLNNGSASTAAEICRDICHDSGALSRTIDQLERRGLVGRNRNDRDRRMLQLVLTPAGRAAVETLAPVIMECEARILEGCSSAEVEMLATLLGRFAKDDQNFAGRRAGRIEP